METAMKIHTGRYDDDPARQRRLQEIAARVERELGETAQKNEPPEEEPPAPHPIDAGERMALGREERARQGLFVCGQVPFGYRRDGKCGLVVHPEEAETVRMIFRLYLARWSSLKKVRDDLNARRLRPRRAKAWTNPGIRHILRNDTYVGRIHYGEIHVQGKHEPLVAPIIFNKAKAKLAHQDKRRKAAP